MLRPLVVIYPLLAVAFGRCPAGSIQGIGPADCYRFFLIAKRWYEAGWTCREENGHLAHVANCSQNGFLARNLPTRGNETFWLGGTNSQLDGQWSWSDGTPFEYDNWPRGQPLPGSSLCLASGVDSGLWRARTCHEELPYVCEVPALLDNDHSGGPGTSTPKPTSPRPRVSSSPVPTVKPGLLSTLLTSRGTTETPPTCPVGWVERNELRQCWKSFPGTPKDILKTCREHDATPMSIHSDISNEMLAQFVAGYPKVLLPLIGRNDSWQWIDKTPFDYSNWAPDDEHECTGTDGSPCWAYLITGAESYGKWKKLYGSDDSVFFCSRAFGLKPVN